MRLCTSIKQREGVTALWKGLGPNLIGVVPARAIYFSTYNHGKHVYTSLNHGKETPVVHVFSAISAGICTAFATNPIWLVKTRMNSFDCLLSVLRNEGIRGLYKGLSASILGLSETTLQFVLYEQMKKRVLASKLEKLKREQLTTGQPLPKPALAWSDTFAMAATAKLIATITTYPHEVLRTRLRQAPVVLPALSVSSSNLTASGAQALPFSTATSTPSNLSFASGSSQRHHHTAPTMPTGLFQMARKIYVEEGLGALYGGLTAHLLRVVPNAALLFATVEFVLLCGEKAQHNGH
ncbi:hypothetical protein HDU96_008576 [Phlyctochytrium bullatum]|nr:hypothetical protein HDU96_008576 [Phlyctochytrium bullatum]